MPSSSSALAASRFLTAQILSQLPDGATAQSMKLRHGAHCRLRMLEPAGRSRGARCGSGHSALTETARHDTIGHLWGTGCCLIAPWTRDGGAIGLGYETFEDARNGGFARINSQPRTPTHVTATAPSAPPAVNRQFYGTALVTPLPVVVSNRTDRRTPEL